MNWARFHLAATAVWVLLLVPTLLWWLSSLVWVVIMSWYAIVVGHWGAYQAARVERKADADVDATDTRSSGIGSAGTTGDVDGG